MLHELGVSLTVADSDGDTPAHSAVSQGQEKCLRVLYELGASITAVNSDGETPAHLAASEGQEGCLRVLHELGVSLTVTDSNGSTPTHTVLALIIPYRMTWGIDVFGDHRDLRNVLRYWR